MLISSFIFRGFRLLPEWPQQTGNPQNEYACLFVVEPDPISPGCTVCEAGHDFDLQDKTFRSVLTHKNQSQRLFRILKCKKTQRYFANGIEYQNKPLFDSGSAGVRKGSKRRQGAFFWGLCAPPPCQDVVSTLERGHPTFSKLSNIVFVLFAEEQALLCGVRCVNWTGQVDSCLTGHLISAMFFVLTWSLIFAWLIHTAVLALGHLRASIFNRT